MNGIDEIWAADLIPMQAFSKDNKGIKYLLTVIIYCNIRPGRSRYPYGARSLDGNRRGGDKNRSHRPGRYPAGEDLSLCGSVFGTAFWTSASSQ